MLASTGTGVAQLPRYVEALFARPCVTVGSVLVLSRLRLRQSDDRFSVTFHCESWGSDVPGGESNGGMMVGKLSLDRGAWWPCRHASNSCQAGHIKPQDASIFGGVPDQVLVLDTLREH